MNRDVLIEIKRSFRQTMNADLANGMKSRGLNYRINFGVPSPRIKLIAAQFDQDISLAEYLWNEDVRESKMLATYLYPAGMMELAKAIEWAGQIPYTEIADQLVMNLFSKLPFARELGYMLVKSDKEITQYAGYALLIRLHRMGMLNIDDEIEIIIASCKDSLLVNNGYLSEAIFNLLLRLSEDDSIRTHIQTSFSEWHESENSLKNNVYEIVLQITSDAL